MKNLTTKSTKACRKSHEDIAKITKGTISDLCAFCDPIMCVAVKKRKAFRKQGSGVVAAGGPAGC